MEYEGTIHPHVCDMSGPSYKGQGWWNQGMYLVRTFVMEIVIA